ncbi:MAG: hypothetical protein ACI84R_000336 [Candidatus Azotimanducaceae bacterium]
MLGVFDLDDIVLMLSKREALGFTLLVVFLILPIALSRFPHNGDPEKTPPLIALQKRIGLEQLNSGLFFIAVVMWVLIFASLFFGLLSTIWLVISNETPTTSDEVWDWRFTLAGMAALTATLGAVVALPATLVRLTYARRQTDTAIQALFNDKIDAAVSDLHAQRKITKWDDEEKTTGWEDDVTRRNGAIDRLLGLASEEPNAAPRIARMLSIYVKELSRELPAKAPPETDDPITLREWAGKLRFARSDMQNAVQVLGKLRAESRQDLDQGEIDLSETNLQGFEMSSLNFEKVSFNQANLQGANLGFAQLRNARFIDAGLQGASLIVAKLHGANLFNAKLQGADIQGAELQKADLQDAKLQGAGFRGAYLRRADLRGAKLHRADLRGVELQGADLREAVLQGVDFQAAKFDIATKFAAAVVSYAAVRLVDFDKTTITEEQLKVMYGDASVGLSDGIGPRDLKWPKHWSKKELSYDDFLTGWRAFQTKNGYDPKAPHKTPSGPSRYIQA